MPSIQDRLNKYKDITKDLSAKIDNLGVQVKSTHDNLQRTGKKIHDLVVAGGGPSVMPEKTVEKTGPRSSG